MDMRTDVYAVPGKRTSGTGAKHFAVAFRGWAGSLPGGIERIESPTSHLWTIGRTHTNGPKDCGAVHEVQDGCTVTPLPQGGQGVRAREP